MKVNSSSCILSIEYLMHIRRRRRQRRRRRRLRLGQRLVKKSVFLFYFGISHLFGTTSVSVCIKTCSCWITSDAFNSKVTCCGSRSPDNAEFSHYMHVSVLQRTAKKRTKNYNARHNHCFPHYTFCLATSSLPLLSCYARKYKSYFRIFLHHCQTASCIHSVRMLNTRGSDLQ